MLEYSINYTSIKQRFSSLTAEFICGQWLVAV